MINSHFKINRGLIVALLIIFYGFFGCFAQEMPSLDSTRKVIRPRAALIRSAIIPGWGQVYNKKPLKGLLYLSVESYFVYNFIYYNRLYGYVKETKKTVGLDIWVGTNTTPGLTEAEKKDAIFAITGHKLSMNTWRPREKRNKYAWWSMGFYLICMLDAYVDAHLYYFPDEKVELTAALKPNGIELNLLFNCRR